jgi:GntR family transcriptional regulator
LSLPIRVSHDSAEPLYHQIATQIRALIFSGHLPAGTLLPSIRELAKETECSVITIRRVYQELESEGLVKTRQGTGTFVADVDSERRKQYQQETVLEALRQVLERIKPLGITKEQLLDIFERAYHQVFEEGNRP